MNVEDLEAILEGIAPHLTALREELDATKAELAAARVEIAELKAAPVAAIETKLGVAIERYDAFIAAFEQREAVADFVKSLESSIAAEVGEDANDAA